MSNLFINEGGTLVPVGGGGSPGPWTNVVFEAGWEDQSVSRPTQWQLNGDRVELRGTPKKSGSAIDSGDVMFILPPEAHPANQTIMDTMGHNIVSGRSEAHGVTAEIDGRVLARPWTSRNQGSASGSSDGSGDFYINHLLGLTPSSYQASPLLSTPEVGSYYIRSISATQLRTRSFSPAGVRLDNSPVSYTWQVSVVAALPQDSWLSLETLGWSVAT